MSDAAKGRLVSEIGGDVDDRQVWVLEWRFDAPGRQWSVTEVFRLASQAVRRLETMQHAAGGFSYRIVKYVPEHE